MATDLQKKKSIRYTGKDFESYKREIINHIKVHFPDIYSDFNESSLGVLLVELMAYVGDNMSFYLDKQFQETFLETAKQEKNIFKHLKSLGVKTSVLGKSVASGVIDAFVVVPSTVINSKIVPDSSYFGRVLRGAKIRGPAGNIYETTEDIDFTGIDVNDANSVRAYQTNSVTGTPTNFIILKKNIQIKAGQTRSTTFSVGAYQSFRKIVLDEEDVIEIESVKDSDGNEYYEVDYLAQDTVFDGVSNTSSDSTEVPYVLKLRTVPYRFVTEYNPVTQQISLTFGTGDGQNLDTELVPDPGDISLPLYGRGVIPEIPIDPQNFLKTRTLGVAPVNTTLTVKYRIGGGLSTNAAAGEVNSVSEAAYEVADSSLSAVTISQVQNSFSVLNTGAIQGGRDAISIEEIKQLASANFASQNRMVTAEDFVVRTLSMPPKFGSVFRAFAKPSHFNRNSVELYTITRNSSNQLADCSSTLKQNLKKYLSKFRMLTDAIEILDCDVINIGVEFGVLTRPEYAKTEVLSNCLLKMKEYFDISRWQINQPVNISEVMSNILSVPGVLSVYDLKIINKVGGTGAFVYSQVVFNIQQNTSNGIVYCKENGIFNVRYPLADIQGAAK